jgi:hypothetical protein
MKRRCLGLGGDCRGGGGEEGLGMGLEEGKAALRWARGGTGLVGRAGIGGCRTLLKSWKALTIFGKIRVLGKRGRMTD